MRALLSLILPFIVLFARAQERIPFRVGSDEGYVEGGSVDQKAMSIDANKEYHWIKGQRLHVTQGGFDGRLLHGPYASFFPDGQLREAGRYLMGVKHGVWRTWAHDGRLLEVRRWSNGQLNGWSDLYELPGREATRERYRRGKLLRTEPMHPPPAPKKEKKVKAARKEEAPSDAPQKAPRAKGARKEKPERAKRPARTKQRKEQPREEEGPKEDAPGAGTGTPERRPGTAH